MEKRADEALVKFLAGDTDVALREAGPQWGDILTRIVRFESRNDSISRRDSREMSRDCERLGECGWQPRTACCSVLQGGAGWCRAL